MPAAGTPPRQGPHWLVHPRYNATYSANFAIAVRAETNIQLNPDKTSDMRYISNTPNSHHIAFYNAKSCVPHIPNIFYISYILYILYIPFFYIFQIFFIFDKQTATVGVRACARTQAACACGVLRKQVARLDFIAFIINRLRCQRSEGLERRAIAP